MKKKIIISFLFNVFCMAFVIQAKTDLLFKVEQTVLNIIQEEGNVTFYVVVCKQGDRSKTTILRLNEEPKSVLCLNEEQKLIFQKLSVLVQQSQSIFIVQVHKILLLNHWG
jgi:hypothetical protein